MTLWPTCYENRWTLKHVIISIDVGTLQPWIRCVETVEHELPALALPAFLTSKARKIQITDWEAVSGRDVSRVIRCLHCDSLLAGIRILPKYTKMPCKMFFGSKDVTKYLWILHPCRRCQFPTLSKCRTFSATLAPGKTNKLKRKCRRSWPSRWQVRDGPNVLKGSKCEKKWCRIRLRHWLDLIQAECWVHTVTCSYYIWYYRFMIHIWFIWYSCSCPLVSFLAHALEEMIAAYATRVAMRSLWKVQSHKVMQVLGRPGTTCDPMICTRWPSDLGDLGDLSDQAKLWSLDFNDSFISFSYSSY